MMTLIRNISEDTIEEHLSRQPGGTLMTPPWRNISEDTLEEHSRRLYGLWKNISEETLEEYPRGHAPCRNTQRTTCRNTCRNTSEDTLDDYHGGRPVGTTKRTPRSHTRYIVHPELEYLVTNKWDLTWKSYS